MSGLALKRSVSSVPVITTLWANVWSAPGAVRAQTMAARPARNSSTATPAEAMAMRRHFEASAMLAVAST